MMNKFKRVISELLIWPYLRGCEIYGWITYLLPMAKLSLFLCGQWGKKYAFFKKCSSSHTKKVKRNEINFNCILVNLGFPGGASGKEPTCQCRRHKRFRFDPWIQKIPWRRKWQPTPLFLPGECQVLRSLAGYSPWGLKVLDRSEAI